MINNFKIVYIDYSLRLVTQFIVISVFVKKLTKVEFADFSFYLMLSGYITIVVNSGFDSLINRHLADKDKDAAEEFYFQTLKLKIIIYIISATVLTCILNTTTIIPFLALSLISIILEHQDIKMRFQNNYKPVSWRILAFPVFFIGKMFVCFNASILGFLLVASFEVFYCILVNYKYSPKLFILGQERAFFKKFWPDFSKTISSGGLVFTFLQIDQFIIYLFLGKEIYSGYALASRFYALVNSLVGIFARYKIPQLYLGDSTYRHALFQLYGVQLFFSMGAIIGLTLYITFWVPDYLDSLYILAILLFCGVGLIFGQVKGVYFVKAKKLMPDIYNAIFGIMVFLFFYFCLNISNGIGVAVCYLIAITASGLISTFFYKTGWGYLKLLVKG